jgi:outer membrane receptor protein involved in Fe transport
MLTIDWFSADELLNEGTSPYVSYYGYDHTGKKLKNKPSFEDFFSKKDEFGNNTREIPAFEPIYMAGYIQDKFAFRDLIFNIGVRVDRFDANQKVLKDPYLLYEAYTVRDVTQIGGNDVLHPSNMGSDFVVYVDEIRNPTQINGYRSGDVWYNNQGIEITDPALIRGAGGIAPYLVDPSLTRPTADAFKDYEPQITVMPRISFSFPISDEALFFAHYDVLSKRPTSGLRLDPTDYYFITAQGQNLLNNPSLKPELTIDYELGFQQLLNIRSAIKFSAYYREIRNLVQAYRFSEAYPRSYFSYNNIDFGTVKGLTISYDLRRSANVWIKASYTLQFADGTGSSATSAVTLVRAGQPNLRIINPLDFDRRHNFSLVLDYRFQDGKNYNGPSIPRKLKDGSDKIKMIPILQNTGANITFLGGSGVPYSRSSTIVPTQIGGGTYVLQGSLNGSRLPWQFTMNARIDRDIALKFGPNKKKVSYANVYIEILNVLNAMNIMNVYRATGNPDDDGYLAAAEYQAGINAQLDPIAFREQYALKVNSPYNYSLPRRLRLGIMLNF